MNPNLLTMSYSNISLDEGQKIFFFNHKKKYLLLEVGDSTPKEIIVNKLIDERKKELKLD